MLEFPPNTYALGYEDGAYLCDDFRKEPTRVEAPLNLETLEGAVRQCPKLQQVGIDDAPFGDECFPILAQIPKLEALALPYNRHITGHGLELLKELPLKQLYLHNTALDDEGLSQAAQIKKLKVINIIDCRQLTFEGLLAIVWRDNLQVNGIGDDDWSDPSILKQYEAFEDVRTYKNMKNRLSLTGPELQEPVAALQDFFDDITRWEQMADRRVNGSEAQEANAGLAEMTKITFCMKDAADEDRTAIQSAIDALFAKRVSWKPRPGYRPVDLSWRLGRGTYTNHRLIVGEKVTKNKFWIYSEENFLCDRSYYRFLLRKIDGKWMIDNAQECQQGCWKFCGL